MTSPRSSGVAPAVETVRCLFDGAVREHAKKDLLISDEDGSRFTYADAGLVVRRIMARLTSSGVQKGDRICTCAPARAESFLLFWAAACLGAVFVPLDHAWPEPVVARVLGRMRPRFLFGQHDIRSAAAWRKQAEVVLFDDAARGDHPDIPSFSRWLEGASGDVGEAGPSPDDAAVILFTSGSTGEPKGVVLSQGALYRSGRLVQELFQWKSDDVLLSPGDLHAMSGLRNPGVAALHAGCSVVVASPERRSDLFALVDCIHAHRCTQLSTIPVLLRQLVQFRDRIPAAMLGSLRSVVCAGSALSPKLLEEFLEHFRIPVLDYYGLTETCGLCIGHSRESARTAAGSIGLPVGCVAEIVDDSGGMLPDGEVGELRVRSRNLLTEYYGDPEGTGRVLRDGWLYTGDLAMKRDDGHIVLKGRLRNIIKNARTELISLEEVELALERHPAVREAAACGFTSSAGDERMAAFIVPGSSVADRKALFRELRQYLLDELGANKVPALFYLKDELPRSSMGKVVREELKKEIAEQ